jgi:2-methylcitrate dehydratase PrpD
MATTKRLAEYALDLAVEDVPQIVHETARMRILDTIGVALAGSQQDCARIADKTDREVGGAGATTVVGMQRKTSCLQAAFINGVSAHALEFDDITSSVITHTSATVVPSVLALAEHVDASGKDLLGAYIVGFEVSTRIGWGMNHNLLPRGWHPNGVLAGIGSAAAGSRLLRSSLDQTRAAIGIAASCSAGLRKNVGSMTKPFHMGHAALNGILAAQLARNGYTADLSVMEQSDRSLSSVPSTAQIGHGHYSFPEVFAGPGGYDLSQIEGQIGTRYELATDSTITRFHPGSTFPQAAIDETIALVTRHNLAPDSLASIRVGVTPLCLAIAPYGKPSNGVYARFSAPYAIAVAALDREVTIRQYADERVRRSDVQTLLDATELYVPDDFADVRHTWSEKPPTPVSCRVEIKTKDGRVFNGARDTTRGYPGTRVTWNDINGKFLDCAALVMPDDKAKATADMVQNLTEVKSVRQLTALIA